MSLLPEQTAIASAVGYVPLSKEELVQPFPVETVLPASQIKNAKNHPACVDGWPLVQWNGDWWPAPTMEEVEEWVFDSVCFTPDEDEVEPDHPNSWLSILGII